MASGIAGLDALLGGGIEQGSSTLLLGPAGTGKCLITLQFVGQAIRSGDKAAMFIFDEELGLLFDRAKPLGFDLEAHARHRHALLITQLDAAELSPGEFAHSVRDAVQDAEVRTVVIDSLNGYQAAMPEENSLILHMHELLQFLQPAGRLDLPDRRAARAGRRHEGAGRRHLPGRHGDPAALLRGAQARCAARSR